MTRVPLTPSGSMDPPDAPVRLTATGGLPRRRRPEAARLAKEVRVLESRVWKLGRELHFARLDEDRAVSTPRFQIRRRAREEERGPAQVAAELAEARQSLRDARHDLATAERSATEDDAWADA